MKSAERARRQRRRRQLLQAPRWSQADVRVEQMRRFDDALAKGVAWTAIAVMVVVAVVVAVG